VRAEKPLNTCTTCGSRRLPLINHVPRRLRADRTGLTRPQFIASCARNPCIAVPARATAGPNRRGNGKRNAALRGRRPNRGRNVGNHGAVSVKGAPARPQYPLRGSEGDGSLFSHRHIMQPAPWHRKKCPLI